MSNFSENFSVLEENVKHLIQQKKETEEERNSLKIQLEEMMKKSQIQQKEIEELIEKNKILRIAGGTKGEDSREIKLKINEMVREVDKCIAQLNQ